MAKSTKSKTGLTAKRRGKTVARNNDELNASEDRIMEEDLLERHR